MAYLDHDDVQLFELSSLISFKHSSEIKQAGKMTLERINRQKEGGGGGPNENGQLTDASLATPSVPDQWLKDAHPVPYSDSSLILGAPSSTVSTQMSGLLQSRMAIS